MLTTVIQVMLSVKCSKFNSNLTQVRFDKLSALFSALHLAVVQFKVQIMTFFHLPHVSSVKIQPMFGIMWKFSHPSKSVCFARHLEIVDVGD